MDLHFPITMVKWGQKEMPTSPSCEPLHSSPWFTVQGFGIFESHPWNSSRDKQPRAIYCLQNRLCKDQHQPQGSAIAPTRLAKHLSSCVLSRKHFPNGHFWKCCSPNILAGPHLQDNLKVHLQLCLQEIHVKLIHYLEMPLSFLLIKSTFQIPAPNAQLMWSGHSELGFSSLCSSCFICCPQPVFSVSGRAVSDLSYHWKTPWIKSCLPAMPGTPGNHTQCQEQHPPCRQRAINSCSAHPTPLHAEPLGRERKAREL